MKVFFLVLIMLGACSNGVMTFDLASFIAALSPTQTQSFQQRLQQIFNGFWEQGGLPDPVEASKCFDENASKLTVTFIGDLLGEITNEKIIQIPPTISNFKKNFPPETMKCLENTAEIGQLSHAYGISDMSAEEVEYKVVKYIGLHLKSLKTSASKGFSDYNAGRDKELGDLLGFVAKQMVFKYSGGVLGHMQEGNPPF